MLFVRGDCLETRILSGKSDNLVSRDEPDDVLMERGAENCRVTQWVRACSRRDIVMQGAIRITSYTIH